MPQLPDDISYEDWLRYVFDHPSANAGEEWHFEDDIPYWDTSSNAHLAVAHVTRAFNEIDAISGRFSDRQMNQGITFIISEASNPSHMEAQRIQLFHYLKALLIYGRFCQCIKGFTP
ncbi:MAG: hypothetical protein AAF653_11160 [Chloroflexota bacterium]